MNSCCPNNKQQGNTVIIALIAVVVVATAAVLMNSKFAFFSGSPVATEEPRINPEPVSSYKVVVGDVNPGKAVMVDSVELGSDAYIVVMKDVKNEKVVAKINVGGKELSLSTIIGNLHMVKGKELEMMKRAICLDKDKIKAELEKHKCTSQLDILHDIVSKVSCDFGDWKYGYRQELKKMLHPDNIDSFRSQKEIDAAWDRLHPKEGKLNFSNWLKLRETK
jgi:flagellar basal body-associated protein FliL